MASVTYAAPSGEADASLAQSAFAAWLERLAGGTLAVAVTVAVCLVIYLLGQVLIRALTRSVMRGLPVSRRARKALARATAQSTSSPTDHLLDQERRRRRAQTLRTVLNSALAVVLITVIVVALLNALSVPLGPLLASAGVVGVALGFGAQSLVKDVISGMFMLMEDQYGVGDVIDVGVAQGTVEEFGLRTTRLRAIDGTVWHVPNGQIQRVGNMTRLWSRVVVEVRFHYDTDLDEARSAMVDAVEAATAADAALAAAVLKAPEVAGIESLTYNSVTLRLLVDVLPSTQWAAQRAIRRELRRILAERDIELAPPEAVPVIGVHHRDVRFGQAPGTADATAQPVEES